MGQSQSQHAPAETTVENSQPSSALSATFTGPSSVPQNQSVSPVRQQVNNNSTSFPPASPATSGRRRAVSTFLRKKRAHSIVVAAATDADASLPTGAGPTENSDLNQPHPIPLSRPTPLSPSQTITSPSPLPITSRQTIGRHSSIDTSTNPARPRASAMPSVSFKGKGISKIFNPKSWIGHDRSHTAPVATTLPPTLPAQAAVATPSLAQSVGNNHSEPTSEVKDAEKIIPTHLSKGKGPDHGSEADAETAIENTTPAVLASSNSQPLLASGSRPTSSIPQTFDDAGLAADSILLSTEQPTTTVSPQDTVRPTTCDLMPNPTTSPNMIPEDSLTSRRRIAMLSGTLPSTSDDPASSASPSPISSSEDPLEQDPAFIESPPSSIAALGEDRAPWALEDPSDSPHPTEPSFPLEEPDATSVVSHIPQSAWTRIHAASAASDMALLRRYRDEGFEDWTIDTPMAYAAREVIRQYIDILLHTEGLSGSDRRRETTEGNNGAENTGNPEVYAEQVEDSAAGPVSNVVDLSQEPPIVPESALAPMPSVPRNTAGSLLRAQAGTPASQPAPTPVARTIPVISIPSLPIIPAGTTMIVQGVVQTADGPPPSYSPPTNAPSAGTNSSGLRTTSDSTLASDSPSNGPLAAGSSQTTRRERPRSFLSRTARHSIFSSSRADEADELGRLDETPTPSSSSRAAGTATESSPTTGPSALNATGDNPAGAAELLGALLIAAASATANMLLSEPPQGSDEGGSPQRASDDVTNAGPSASTAPGQQPTSSNDSSDDFLDRIRRNLSGDSHPRRARSHSPAVNGDAHGTDGLNSGRTAIAESSTNPTPRRWSSAIRERPRSLINSLRDRLFNGPTPDPWLDDVDERHLFWPPGAPTSEGNEASGSTSARAGGSSRAPGAAAEDPIEALRERIATELMRALARENSDTRAPSRAPPPDGAAQYPQPLSPTSSPSYIPYPPTAPSSSQSPDAPPPSSPASQFSTILGRSMAAAPAGTNNASELPAEGTFDRFLHDTNVDLRNTLLERMQRRQGLPVTLPLPAGETPPSDAAPGTSEQTTDGTAPTTETPAEQAPSAQGSSSEPQVFARAPDGIIEPRLNWWRMYQFPPRIVRTSATATGDNQPSTASGSPASTTTATPTTTDPTSTSDGPSGTVAPLPSNVSTLIPVIVVGIRTAPTILVQDIAALTSSAQAAAAPAPIARPSRTSRFTRPLSRVRPSTPPPVPSTLPADGLGSAEGSSTQTPGASSSTDTTPSVAERPRSRAWPSRIARAISRGLTPNNGAAIFEDIERARQNLATLQAMLDDEETRLRSTVPPPGSSTPTPVPAESAGEPSEAPPTENTATAATATVAPPAPRDRTRNYLIWVIGGYYPENHPILTSPNLLLNHFDQEDLWGLADLLGQVKPPVASKSDIDRAGLEVVKASALDQLQKEGKVQSNTADRCAICLGDYEPEEDLRIMSCKHVFHQECVDKWLEKGRNNCPACRTKGVPVRETPPAESTSAAA